LKSAFEYENRNGGQLIIQRLKYLQVGGNMNKKMQHLARCTGQCDYIYRLAWRLTALLVLLICGSSVALAQLSTADILGTVTDTTGALVSKATITLVNLDTQDQRVAISNDSGEFQFTLLPVGHYSATAKKAGFKTTTTNLAVEAGDRARADFHLVAGGGSETVVVEATTPLLQADNATVSSTVTAQSVQDLPLNGRNFVQLVQLVPGANEGPGNGLTSGGRPDDRRTTNGFSVNGQDDTLNNYVVDGIDDNERVIGTIGVKPSVEGIQEITVQTNSYAPEAGRTAGGVVNLVTKSGTNKFHGSLFEFLRNDKFDGRNTLQTTGPMPELRQNQFGGSVGGPIIHDKTFFFGDYEGFRQVSGTTYTESVPTLAEYNSINSQNGGSPAAFVTANGNGIPVGTPIDKVALAYLQLFPAPNVGTAGQIGGNYVISPNKTQFSKTIDVRVDHTINPKNLLFGRYDYNAVNTDTPAAIGAGANPKAPSALQAIVPGGGRWNFAGAAKDDAQQYAFGFTHIFTQNLLVDLRAAYTRINNFSTPLDYNTNADTTVGFPANGLLTTGLSPTGISGLSDLGDGAYVPLQDIDNTFQYAGTVSDTIKTHSLKAGASLIRRQARNVQSAFPFGQYSFGLGTDSNSNSTTQQNQVLASTLVGAFSSSSFNLDLDTPDYRGWEPSFFVQDNWKVNQKLTVVYGIRYDVFTPFTEAHNHISNFDFNKAIGSTAASVGSALEVAGVNGVSSTAGISTIHNNFAPRIGFSYSILPNTVLRGGYGLSFFPGNYTSNADLKNAPFTSVYGPSCESSLGVTIQANAGAASTAYNPSCANVGAGYGGASFQAVYDNGLPTPTAQTINSPGLSFVAEDPKFKPAMIQQFNLQIERQFGPNVLTVGYVGNIGQHLAETIADINVPTPAQVTAGLNAATPYKAPRQLATLLPNLGGVGWLQSEGVSNYNGLQTSFQRRLAKGLAFDANYTWGHALSDQTGFSEEGMQGWADADPTRIRAIDYGNAENDIRNRFALSINYELPFKNFQGPAKYALGGWKINSIVAWQSGKDFSVTNNNGCNGGSNCASPNYNGGPDRPNQVKSPKLAKPTLQEWFDVTAFVPQTLGTVGSTARNSLYGPHFRHIDFSLFKDFPVYDRFTVQFRAETFNITNTPNFYMPNNVNSGPGTRLGNGQFGQITNMDPNYVPRQLQFALKLQF
jgi:hypothetical protein